MVFRQLFDPQSSTYSYLLGDERAGEAVLIDPVFEQARRDRALIGELAARASDLARERPVVAVCRSGARSAQACVILQRMGFSDVANLAGGMLRWRADGFRVEGGRQ